MSESAHGCVNRTIRGHASNLRNLVDGLSIIGDCEPVEYVPDVHQRLSKISIESYGPAGSSGELGCVPLKRLGYLVDLGFQNHQSENQHDHRQPTLNDDVLT